MGSLAQINIRFKADLSGFSNDMQNVARRMQRYGTEMNAIGKSLSTYVTLPLLAAGGAAVKFASDYNESLNKVEVAFGPASTSVKNFAKDSLTSFGIAEGSALDAAATYGDMATSMGLPQSAAAKMSTSLVGLAGDLASFKNIGIDQANTALAGVFTGETESLKKLGIVMTEANLQQFAMSKGIKVQVKDMDQASKVNLRYAYIMANTTNAQGDFVRTGGGAANQSRIFTESLKQLGQQFGSIILPYFTKAITYVNGLVKGFGELSPATKSVIVGIAGIAAAIGPLMYGLGNIIGIIPRMIVQFKALQAVIIANPYIAAGLAIVAIGIAIYSYVKSVNAAKEASIQLTDSQKVLQSITDEASNSIVDQKAKLETLLITARNENDTKKNRLKAIQEINKISPEYLGNLTLENLNTDKARASVEKYNKALLAGAMARAASSLLEKNAQGRIEAGFKREKALAEYNAKRQEAEKKGQEALNNFFEENNRLMQFANEELDRQNSKYDLQDKIATDIYSKNKNYLKLLGDEAVAFDSVAKSSEKVFKKGTESYFEKQISDLKELQKTIPTTNAAWQSYEDRISAVKKQLAALTNKGIKLPKPELPALDSNFSVPSFSLEDLKNQLSYYENLREEFATTSDEYLKLTENINNTKIKINAIEGVDEVSASIDSVKTKLEEFNQSISAAMGSAIATFANGFAGIVANFKNGGNVFSSVGNLFLSTLAGLMIQVGKIAIETGVALLGIKTALKSLNPAIAIGAGVLLVSLGTVAKSKLSDAGGFANGGIVGGTSYYGDRLFARVNSGEMILNQNQQRNLSNMINPAVTAGDVAVKLMGGFEVEGTKLKLLLKRVDEKDKRMK